MYTLPYWVKCFLIFCLLNIIVTFILYSWHMYVMQLNSFCFLKRKVTYKTCYLVTFVCYYTQLKNIQKYHHIHTCFVYMMYNKMFYVLRNVWPHCYIEWKSVHSRKSWALILLKLPENSGRSLLLWDIRVTFGCCGHLWGGKEGGRTAELGKVTRSTWLSQLNTLHLE